LRVQHFYNILKLRCPAVLLQAANVEHPSLARDFSDVVSRASLNDKSRGNPKHNLQQQRAWLFVAAWIRKKRGVGFIPGTRGTSMTRKNNKQSCIFKRHLSSWLVEVLILLKFFNRPLLSSPIRTPQWPLPPPSHQSDSGGSTISTSKHIRIEYLCCRNIS